MQDTPPRRSRRPPPNKSGSSFPLIPIVLGTIVIGFVIGAGLSMAGKHGTEPVAVATPAATSEPTLVPATLAPTEKPTREPTLEPSTPSTPSPRAVAKATHAPKTPAAALAGTPSASPHGATAAASGATTAPSASATRSEPARSPAATSTVAVTTGAPPAADDTDSEFGRLAASVVRGYLSAVARGDSAAAASSLANSGDSVTESGVVDGTTRIRHLEARAVGDAATVNVDFETSTGAYSGQYTVRRTATGAAVIVAHSVLKP